MNLLLSFYFNWLFYTQREHNERMMIFLTQDQSLKKLYANARYIFDE